MNNVWSAIGNGDAGELSEILSRCPDLINEASPRGMLPLVLAVQMDAVPIIRLLIDNGAKVNAVTNIKSVSSGRIDKGVSPIMYASSLAAINLLLEAGADLNLTDGNGMTAFLRVAKLMKVGLVERMVELGYSPRLDHVQWLLASAEDELSYRKKASSDVEGRISELEAMMAWCRSFVGNDAVSRQ